MSLREYLPLFWGKPRKAELEAIAAAIKPHFDASFYLSQNPDVAQAGVDPVSHYVEYGWHEGRDPHPDFSSSHYLQANPDVAGKRLNPFQHYLEQGSLEGRTPKPNGQAVARPEASAPGPDPDIQSIANAIRVHFDSAFYLAANPDVAEAGIDPVEHYVRQGWAEGRNPRSGFSTRYYLQSNPDVAQAKVNPFWHYVVQGIREGRSPEHPIGHLAETLANQMTLSEAARNWIHSRPRAPLLSAGALLAEIRSAAVSKTGRLVVSIGHDHYKKEIGGVQLCIQREEAASLEMGDTYLNLHPWQPLPKLAPQNPAADTTLNVVLNGKDLAPCSASELAAVFEGLVPVFGAIEFVIHHLLGHCPEDVARLARAAQQDRLWLWAHDFFMACPNPHLRRNNMAFCGAPSQNSNACAICLYGAERQLHLKRMNKLLKGFKIHLIAPSDFTRDLWLEATKFRPASISVVPHAGLSWAKRRAYAEARNFNEISVGFIGTPANHKGWPIFQKAAEQLSGDGIKFFFLSDMPMASKHFIHVPVRVTQAQASQMVDAVRNHHIDFVIHWATAPETFSLATFEALAGGAHVITTAGSGNVAATVHRTGKGVVLNDEGELFDFFTSGAAAKRVREIRRFRQRFQPHFRLSRLTYELWEN